MSIYIFLAAKKINFQKVCNRFSKVFECIVHDLLLAKLSAYGPLYNHLKANPEKCHLLLSSETPTDVSIGDASLKTSTKETLLKILIDSELSFDQHLSFICSKHFHLHALGRIATFMSFKKRKALMKAFIELLSPIKLMSPNMDVSVKNNE